MKTRIILLLPCLIFAFAGVAMAEPQQATSQAVLKMLKAKDLITDDDVKAVMDDSAQAAPQESAKPAPAPEKVKISGEMRFRPEMRDNADFNDKVDDNKAFIGQRIRLNFDIKTDSGVKAFISVQDARNWGDVSTVESAANSSTSYGGSTVCTQAQVTAGTACTTTAASQTAYASKGSDRQSLDIYQAWFMLENVGGAPVDFKIGRQQLVYGDQRLLGHLGWQDNGRAFDAYKITARLSAGQIDLFLAKLKETQLKSSDSTNDDDLYGLYTIWPAGEGNKLDVYYLVWKNDAARSVNTYGLRFGGKAGAFDYTAEGAFQGGKWSTGVDHSASAFAVTAGYTLADVMGGLRIGAEYDMGSGDDKADAKTHKTFVFPFHTNHMHYGYMDYFSWGNMTDLAFKIKGKPSGNLTAEIAYHKFDLAQAKDTWLNVAGTGTQWAATTETSTDAGQEIDLTAVYAYNAAVKITVGYSTFAPGQAAKGRSGFSDTSSWGYGMFEFAF